MSNRWINALVKFIIVIVIAHVVVLLFGFFGGSGYSMLWPHLNSWGSAIISVIAAVALYFIIYAWFHGQSANET